MVLDGTAKSREEFYECFYAGGGWRYDIDGEVTWLQEHLFTPLGIDITPSYNVLDVGCGMGLQCEALARLGATVMGVDRSSAGIVSALERFPHIPFLCADIGEVTSIPNSDSDPSNGEDVLFDMVFARGLSWFHYELGELTYNHLQHLLRFLKPGGLFVLLIKTDFSGEYTAPDGVLNNRLEAYRKLFSRKGEIVLCTDWHHVALGDEPPPPGARNIVIAMRPI